MKRAREAGRAASSADGVDAARTVRPRSSADSRGEAGDGRSAPTPNALASSENALALSANALASSANGCFVCGPANAAGLQVRFRLDGEVCRAVFTPASHHVGYDGVTHGGILFSLLDDVMANTIFLGGERCYTAKAEVRYRQALEVGTPVRLEGVLRRRKGRLAICEGRVVRQQDDVVIAEATGSFMIEPGRR